MQKYYFVFISWRYNIKILKKWWNGKIFQMGDQ